MDKINTDVGLGGDLVSGTVMKDVKKQDNSSKFEDVFGYLPKRWKNWVIRVIFTFVMIGGFGLIIYSGPLALMIMVWEYKSQMEKL